MDDDVNKPSARFPHAFVVLRIDDFQASAVENQVSAVSTFMDRALADAEQDRLNDMNSDKGARYVVLLSRLKG